MRTKVAIVGASGTMGRMASALIASHPEFEVFAEIGSADPLDRMIGADVVLDVTVPGSSQSVVDFAISHQLNVLVGTSGWSGDRIQALTHAVAAQPGTGVVIVPNFSLGSVIASTFAALAAQFFDSIEIVEAHGAAKIDSPSGTAVRTAEMIGAARSGVGPVSAPHTDQRARGQQVASVPIHSLRLAGVVARQDVIFGGTGEVLTLTHQTISPSAYEAGILLGLTAARSAVGVTVGLDKLLDLESLLAPRGDSATPGSASKTGTPQTAAAAAAATVDGSAGVASSRDAVGGSDSATDDTGETDDTGDTDDDQPELVSGQAARATTA